MKWALSSFFSLCIEEIFSISSNLIMQFFFLPSAVKVAFTSAVPFRLTYQSNVVSDVGVIRYTNWLTTSWLIVLPLKSIKLFRVERIPSICNYIHLLLCSLSIPPIHFSEYIVLIIKPPVKCANLRVSRYLYMWLDLSFLFQEVSQWVSEPLHFYLP